ncbi:DUF4192 family protein [Nesterenkonia suensis]
MDPHSHPLDDGAPTRNESPLGTPPEASERTPSTGRPTSSGAEPAPRGQAEDRSPSETRAETERQAEELIRISGVGDALALVQHTFGFLPEDSLVVVGLHDARVGAHLRIDLRAGVDHPDGLGRWVCKHLAGPQTSPRPDGAVIYLFTTEAPTPPSWDDPALRPYAALHSSLVELLAAQGVRTVQTWWVGGGHIRDYDCADATCCSYPGQDIQAAARSVLHTHMVYRGRTLSTPRQMVQDFLAPPISLPTRTLEASQSAQKHCGRELSGPEAAQRALWAWESMIQQEVRRQEADRPDPDRRAAARPPEEASERWIEEHHDELVMMAASLSWGDLRDGLLVLAADGFEIASMTLEALRVGGAASSEGGEASWAEDLDHHRLVDCAVERYRAVLLGATGERPGWERIDALATLLSRMQPVLTPPGQAETLALMCWIEWARGRGSISGAYVDRCLDLAPDHPLARLMQVDQGIGRICPWAMVRDHSWSTAGAGQ